MTEKESARGKRLLRLLWLSIGAAVATISLKLLAWVLTGSAGLLSDAAESLVNLAAAIVAMVAMRWSLRPPDEEHAYGHAKAEYFSAGLEGAFILLAALFIAVAAAGRLVDPAPLDDVGLGLMVSAFAALISLIVARLLLRAARQEHSIVLEADGKHLLTDVWTSAGVIVGVALVVLTGWERLDPIIALLVAANIVYTGSVLIRRSGAGLMDRSLDQPSLAEIDEILDRFEDRGLRFHAIRTRQAASRAFISLHVLMPGSWSVKRGHDAAEQVEAALRDAVPRATVFTHLEPAEDPSSFADRGLDRR